MIQVKIFFANNDLRNFSYLIYDSQTGNSWAVDPFDGSQVGAFINSQALNLKGILNTHQHWDHTRGNSYLQSHFGGKVLEEEFDELKLEAQFSLRRLATPGHTMTHQAFLLYQEHQAIALFAGDTLFNSGVGNCKGGGDPDLLYETTLKLMNLPDDVVLYPGHDYLKRNLAFAQTLEPENPQLKLAIESANQFSTEAGARWNLAQEKAINPFLRLHSSEIRQKLGVLEKDLADGAELERDLFKKIRSLRDQW